MIRTKFGERTINGLNRADFDEVNIAGEIDSLTINDNEGSAGQVLSKNPITNKLEFNSVPISDDTITTNMIQDLQINNDKIANTTIQGGKLASDININTTGGIEVHNLVANNDLVVNGNVNLNGSFISLGDAGTDIINTRGTIIFNNGNTPVGTFAATTGVLSVPTGSFTSGLNVGGGNQFVVGNTNSTFSVDVLINGDIEMATGGTEVFNMNSHNLTNGGDATFNNLTLTNGLNLSNNDLDLGSGNFECEDIVCNNILGTNYAITQGTISLQNAGVAQITMNHTNGIISCKGLGTNGNPLDSEGGELRSGGGLINTENGNLNVGSGTITNTGNVNCGAIDTGANNITTTGVVNCGAIDTNGITGPTTLSGSFTLNHTSNPVGDIKFGSGVISSAGTGNITSTNSNLNINAHSGFIQCDGLSTNNGNLQLGSGQISNISSIFGTGLFRASELQLGTTGLGINTSAVVYPNTADIRGYNIYNSTNDIPRILACKSFTADHSYTRTINTTYRNIDKDTTTLNVSFAVPISCKVIVEVGFYVGSTLNNERLMLKLVDNTGAEFFGKFINDANHGFSTENMECQFAGSGNLRGQFVITKFFLSFPTSKRNFTCNLQPQAAVNAGNCILTAGGTSSGQTPPMYVKVESSGNQDQSQFNGYNWYMETSSGGDDY